MELTESKTPTPYWVVSLTRAIIILVPGLFITFTPRHTPEFGLVALGITALVSAAALTWLSLTLERRHPGRGLHLFQAAVSGVVGLIAVVMSAGSIAVLLWAVVVWAVLIGGAETFAGTRLPKKDSLRRDWITQGLLSVGLALVVLTQTGDSVAVVGCLGAWAIVLGVYLGIAGISHKSVEKAMREGLTL